MPNFKEGDKEEWLTVKGFEGYQVSNLWRVKSFRRKKIKILKPGVTGGGYYQVYLQQNNYKKRFQLSRLVAIHFIKNLYNKKQVNHINGNKSDNTVKNLEWVTCSENIKHAYKTGLKKVSKLQIMNAIKAGKKTRFKKGLIPKNRKFNNEEIKIIKKEVLSGKTQTELAKKFSVSIACINYIINKKTYAEVC